MKKLISLVLVAVMVLGCISLAACGGGGGTATTTTPGGGEQGNGGDEQGNGGNGGDEQGNGGDEGASDNLEDILGLGAGIDSVYYKEVITAPGMATMTHRVWIKHNKMRTEVTEPGVTLITIYDGDAGIMYTYYPDQDLGTKTTYDPTTTQSAIGQSQAIADYDYHETGTETIDGKECLVVEYTYQGTTTKVWLWKEHGFPIKVVVTTTDLGTTIIEYQDISFKDIDDSMFEIPPGLNITTIGF